MTQVLNDPATLGELEPTDKYWTLQEYEELVDRGMLDQQRVQLISGRIVQMSPQREKHSIAIENADDFLRTVFVGYRVRTQLPLRFKGDSEPEPDIAILAGKRDRKAKIHPSTAVLIIEVSESSLHFDRTSKARIYAENSIQEYWIINVVDDCIEVHREPDAVAKQYKSVRVYRAGEPMSPVELPNASIDPAELLP